MSTGYRARKFIINSARSTPGPAIRDDQHTVDIRFRSRSSRKNSAPMAATHPMASPATAGDSLSPVTQVSNTSTYRLSLDNSLRIRTATVFAGLAGAALGFSHGAQETGLRFRAENSHRLPTNEKGWYLYHKTKNYAVLLGGFREAAYMGVKVGVWTGLFFAVESAVDKKRRSQDAASSVCAGMAVAGAFSLWNRLPLSTAARMTKLGLYLGLGYGIMQDFVAVAQGRRVGYVDWVSRTTGVNLKSRSAVPPS